VKASANYDLVPANGAGRCRDRAIELPERERRLKEAIQQIQDEYDFVLIDCPPALNLAHQRPVPRSRDDPMHEYALEGLSDLVQTIKKVRVSLNPGLEIEGLLRTMYDPRNTLAQQVSDQLQQHFGEKVYRTIIPRNVRLAEAPSHGMPALSLDRQSKGALAYLALAGEMLSRQPAT
jgi:chromosome partitioning protein